MSPNFLFLCVTRIHNIFPWTFYLISLGVSPVHIYFDHFCFMSVALVILGQYFPTNRIPSSGKGNVFHANILVCQPVAVAEWLVRLTAKQEVSHLSLASYLKIACGESKWLLCWPYTPIKVLHQRSISWNIYHVPLCQVQIRLPTLALNPRDVTKSPK